MEVAGLHAELTVARRDLARVRGERDELRRALNVDFRSIARQEVEAALVANTGRRERMVPTVALAAHLNDPEPPVVWHQEDHDQMCESWFESGAPGHMPCRCAERSAK